MTTVKILAEALDAQVLSAPESLFREISSCYVCDLLSWVVGRAEENSAWITVMNNLNVVAVAVMADISCIIISEGIIVDKATLAKAEAQDIPILSTSRTTFDAALLVGKLLEK